mmetsp:Transcript_23958/g.50799  ORF Transcript_23958/g.50799 Transcript_23958/m.50799 type:complete len:166 (-) Transcript_23958:1483-1980(-)
MMFLPEDKWSPRYDEQFYTIRIKGYITIHNSAEAADMNAYDIFGDDAKCSLSFFGQCNENKNYPATYYEIEVLNGGKRHTCVRRYSQFHRLCQKIIDSSGRSVSLELRKSLPPKTSSPFFRHKKETTKDFLEERMAGLYAFLRGLLVRQECVNNALIEQFLELKN